MKPTAEDAFDMSFDEVIINLDALIKNAANAVRLARNQMQRDLSEIEQLPRSSSVDDMFHFHHHSQYYAQVLARSTQDYALAWKIYFALYECKTRSKLEIIRSMDGKK